MARQSAYIVDAAAVADAAAAHADGAVAAPTAMV